MKKLLIVSMLVYVSSSLTYDYRGSRRVNSYLGGSLIDPVDMSKFSKQSLQAEFDRQTIGTSFGSLPHNLADILNLRTFADNLPVLEVVLMHMAGATAAELSQMRLDHKRDLILRDLGIDYASELPTYLSGSLVRQLKAQINSLQADYQVVHSNNLYAGVNLHRLVESFHDLDANLVRANGEVRRIQHTIDSYRQQIADLEVILASLNQQISDNEVGLSPELQAEVRQVRSERITDMNFAIGAADSLNTARQLELRSAESDFKRALKPYQDRLAEFQAKLAMARPEDPERVAATKSLNELLKLDPSTQAGHRNYVTVRKAIEEYDADHSRYIFPMIDDEGLGKWRVALMRFDSTPELVDGAADNIEITIEPEADLLDGVLESKTVSPETSGSPQIDAIWSGYESSEADRETKGEPVVLLDSKDEPGSMYIAPGLAAGAAGCAMPVSSELFDWAGNLGVSAMNSYLKANPNDLAVRLSVDEMNERLPKIRAILQRIDNHAAHNSGRMMLGLNRGDVDRWKAYLRDHC